MTPKKTKTRRQRHKSAVTPVKSPTVSAAVSIPEKLYLTALGEAAARFDGNFSGYVRALIKRDLNAA